MTKRKPKRRRTRAFTKCKTKYCRAQAKRGGLCYKCEHERTKERNPYRYFYGIQKRNAKRRKKIFTISFEEWFEFAVEYDYIQKKGRTANSLSVDCKINELGYVSGNLQPMTVANNARKGTKMLDYDYVTGTARVHTLTAEQNNYDTPF
jgi:hypothetical protein